MCVCVSAHKRAPPQQWVELLARVHVSFEALGDSTHDFQPLEENAS